MTLKHTLSACLLGLAAACALPAAAGAPPSELKIVDTVPGKGMEAIPGATLTVHYTGWLYAPDAPQQHGTQFDSSVGGPPFTFRLGAGKVIPGWDKGLAGMKVGGKRTIIVPSILGYGTRGAGPIPPNANLIFDVELVGIK